MPIHLIERTSEATEVNEARIQLFTPEIQSFGEHASNEGCTRATHHVWCNALKLTLSCQAFLIGAG